MQHLPIEELLGHTNKLPRHTPCQGIHSSSESGTKHDAMAPHWLGLLSRERDPERQATRGEEALRALATADASIEDRLQTDPLHPVMHRVPVRSGQACQRELLAPDVAPALLTPSCHLPARDSLSIERW